jgi:hypothetical protein
MRILVFADAMAATQHISFVQPLEAACGRGDARLVVIAERDLDGFSLGAFRSALETLFADVRPTAVVFSRAGTRFVADIIAAARSAKARIITHLDDDLFAVPASLGAGKAAIHNDPARLARLTIACRRADAIYASTSALGAALEARFSDRPVHAGRIYAAAYPPFTPFAIGGPPVFGYMGTAGHLGDLELIAPAIALVLQRFPDARFETFGTIRPPASLAAFGARVTAHPRADDYDSFMTKLKGLRWRVGLAPLADTPFNACKADTKFVEYAQAGIPCVLARHSVYQRPLAAGAALGAGSTEEWAKAVLGLLADEAGASRLAGVAQACLRSDYSAGALEAQLMAVLRPADRSATSG